MFRSMCVPRDSGDVVTELVAAVNVLRESLEKPVLRRDACLLEFVEPGDEKSRIYAVPTAK